MTVREWLNENNMNLDEVSVISAKWGCNVVDHRRPESTYMDIEVKKTSKQPWGRLTVYVE